MCYKDVQEITAKHRTFVSISQFALDLHIIDMAFYEDVLNK